MKQLPKYPKSLSKPVVTLSGMFKLLNLKSNSRVEQFQLNTNSSCPTAAQQKSCEHVSLERKVKPTARSSSSLAFL